MASSSSREMITDDDLPNPAGNVHGATWGGWGETGNGVSPNTKVDPVFGKIPDRTEEYGGSDC